MSRLNIIVAPPALSCPKSICKSREELKKTVCSLTNRPAEVRLSIGGAQVTYVGLGWPTWPPTWVGQIGWLAHFGGHSCPRPTPCLSCHRLSSLLTCFSSQNHPLPIRNADNGFQMPPFDRISFFLLTSSRFPFKETKLCSHRNKPSV